MVIAVTESELSREEYRRLREDLSVEAVPPPGLVIHTVAEADGKLRAFDLWESAEAAQSFYQDRLASAMASSTPGVPPGRLEMWDVIDVLRA